MRQGGREGVKEYTEKLGREGRDMEQTSSIPL